MYTCRRCKQKLYKVNISQSIFSFPLPRQLQQQNITLFLLTKAHQLPPQNFLQAGQVSSVVMDPYYALHVQYTLQPCKPMVWCRHCTSFWMLWWYVDLHPPPRNHLHSHLIYHLCGHHHCSHHPHHHLHFPKKNYQMTSGEVSAVLLKHKL